MLLTNIIFFSLHQTDMLITTVGIITIGTGILGTIFEYKLL